MTEKRLKEVYVGNDITWLGFPNYAKKFAYSILLCQVGLPITILLSPIIPVIL